MALHRTGLKVDMPAAALTLCCVTLLGMTSVETGARAPLQQGLEGPAAEPAGPDPVGPPTWDGLPACPQLLIEALLPGCPISVDRLSLQFSRGSDAPLPADEVARLAAELNANGLPVNRCCSIVADVVAARCGCTAAYAAELEGKLQLEGTTTLAFVQGALGVLRAACQAEAACPEEAGAGR